MSLASPILLLGGLLLIAGCTTAGNRQIPASRSTPLKDRPDIYEALRDYYAQGKRADAGQVDLDGIELYRFSGRTKQFVAICKWPPHDRSDFIVFEFEEGEIIWVADADQPPVDDTIVGVKPVTLPGFKGPCLEVYGATRKGNGYFYLYHLDLEQRKLELILKTFAVDRYGDGTLIRGGKLVPVYYMPTRLQSRGNIVFAGIVDYYDEATDDPDAMPIKSRRVHVIYYWNNAKKRYQSDPDEWLGMEPYKDKS